MSSEIKGMIDINFISSDSWNKSNISYGPLKLPKGMTIDDGSELIVVGENDKYLHCFFTNGTYYGIFKSNDKNHMYQCILNLNKHSAKTMNKEEFIKQYCERSNISYDELEKTNVVLPCSCNEALCKGWAVVSDNPLSIKTHNRLY